MVGIIGIRDEGTLIVGGTARPDLVAPDRTEPLARAAWRSITKRLLTLPDDLVVHPTPTSGVTVLDVRQESEWQQRHVPGAVHIELGALADRAAQIPAGRIVAHCMHGQRSMTAASVLERAGRDDVAVFTGGPDQWLAGAGSA